MAAPIVLVLKANGEMAVAEVVSQLPGIDSVPAGTKLVIAGRLASPTGLLARIFSGKKTVPRAVRSSALLARGFVDIAAASEGDDDLVWGFAPGD
ncbi:MAG: hypothetical protein ABIP39_02635 [Polyangiaceae bacterium]